MEYMAGSVRKEPDQQTWGPEFESREPRYKCLVHWCTLLIPVQRRWNWLERLSIVLQGSPQWWACKHVHLAFFFMWDLGSKLGSFGCVASILSVELPDQPSNLLLQHSLIVIHEVCLLFKYTTMEISIFNVSVNFGLWLFNQPSLVVGSLLRWVSPFSGQNPLSFW